MNDEVQRLEGTKQAILERLLPGEQHVLAVANELRIRESAIRRHFDQLERKGLVRGFFRQEGLGRPKKYYALTDWGRERFPRVYMENLQRSLRRIVQDGRARDLDEAVHVLAQDRIEQHRSRFQLATTPLALARSIERAVGEVGLTVRGRVKSGSIQFDLTSCVLLRSALKREDVPDGWWHDVLRRVAEAAPEREGLKIEAGDRLCPPASATAPTLSGLAGTAPAGTEPATAGGGI